MKILVFVSKWIGNELINVLFSQFNDDEFTFIVSGPYSDEIIKKLQKNSCTYMILNQSTINWILQKDNYRKSMSQKSKHELIYDFEV